MRAVAFEGVAKWSTCLFVCTCLALGCASSVPAAAAPHRHWVPGYLFGIWGKAEFDVRDDCPETGAASVRVGATVPTLLATVITLGLYTPRQVSVQCRVAP